MEKERVKKIFKIIVIIVSAFIIASHTNLIFWEYIADNLLTDMEMAVGINPTLSVLLSSLLSIIVGIVLFLKMRNNNFSKTLSIFTLSFFILQGILNYNWRLNDDSLIDVLHLSNDKQEKYVIFKNEKEGFSYIGEVNGYENNQREDKQEFLLFVKSIDGKKYYYALPNRWIFDYNNLDEYLIDTKRGVIEKHDKYSHYFYTIEYDFDGVNNHSKNSEKTRENNHNEESETSYQSENHTEPQKIVVEHQHTPQPVQQWQACFACGGRGTMDCYNCGGSGTKYIGDKLDRCFRCNGRGEIPCNTCYGNKGQYITVYR